MQEAREKTIDTVHYTVTQFPPRKSMRILSKIVKIAGGPLSALLSSSDGTLDKEVDPKLIGEAVMILAQNLGDDDLYDLFKEICDSVIAKLPNGSKLAGGGLLKDDKFDGHFSDPQALSRMFKVVIFALEVNYKDFLSGLNVSKLVS